MLAAKTTDDAIVEKPTWPRCPVSDRRRKGEAVEALADATGEERRKAIEDLFWSILSSQEFLFNH